MITQYTLTNGGGKRLPDCKSIKLTIANAGDARIVLGQEGCPAVRLSVDHRVDDNLEVHRIANAGGFCWKNRVLGVLAVTRSLGDQLLKEYVIAEPSVTETCVPVEQNCSFVIIACDGLWDVLSDEEAVDIVRNFGGDKQNVADCLVQEGLTRGTSDNLTCIVAWL